MSARHYLMHLAVAYNHYHPIDEHKNFENQVTKYDKNQLRDEIGRQLDNMQKRCELQLTNRNSKQMISLMNKIKALKNKIAR